METKKTSALNCKYLTFETQCKQQKNDLIIEGFANRFAKDGKLLVDRGNDLIPPEAFSLDEFKALPIIFFNHDRDQPIGKALSVQAKEDGLYIKAKLSSSDHPEVKRIRSLVKEGILKAFSVGFDPIKIDQEEVEGKQVNVIKEANLLEVSVVSLPMAQHSLFSVTSKSLSEMPIGTARNILSHPEWFDVKQGIPSQISEAELSNPMLDIMKQGNVFLATLIREMQIMNERLSLLQPMPQENQEEEPEEPEEPEEMPEEPEDEPEPPEDEPEPPEPPEDEEEEETQENRRDDDDKEDYEPSDGKPGHYDDDRRRRSEEDKEKMNKKLTIIDRYSDVCNKILANTGH